MIKINITNEIKSFYKKEIELFFIRSQTHKLKDYECIIYNLFNTDFLDFILLEYNEIKKIVKKIDNKKIIVNPYEKEIFIKLYESFRKSVASKNFIKKLNIQTCPYCNRNYIFNFTKKNQQETTAQLDHFFDKSKYPYLAISIYNLIPSCNVCNQRKSSKQENIFYPYEESFNDSVKFKYKYNNLSDIEIKFDIKSNKEKANNHIEIFNLEHLYNEHTDIVLELIQKREIYSDTYIDELTNQYPNIFKNKEDVLRLITCGYVDDKDLHKRPLSKLIKDISEQLEL